MITNLDYFYSRPLEISDIKEYLVKDNTILKKTKEIIKENLNKRLRLELPLEGDKNRFSFFLENVENDKYDILFTVYNPDIYYHKGIIVLDGDKFDEWNLYLKKRYNIILDRFGYVYGKREDIIQLFIKVIAIFFIYSNKEYTKLRDSYNKAKTKKTKENTLTKIGNLLRDSVFNCRKYI